MGNCLVTKLKGTVDNNLLPKLGSLIVKVTMSKAANIIYIGKPHYDTIHQVTLRIVQGDAFLADTAEAASGVQSIDVLGQENNQVVYLHGAIDMDVYLSVDNYQYLSLFEMNEVGTPDIWPTVTMDWGALKYSSIFGLIVKPNKGAKLEIGTINTLYYPLLFAPDNGCLTFDVSKATSQHTPDIGVVAAFETVDMAIDAIIYYMDKYSGSYNNGANFNSYQIVAFIDLPEGKKAAVYDALYYPLANSGVSSITFLGHLYTVSNGQLLEDGIVVTPPSN